MERRKLVIGLSSTCLSGLAGCMTSITAPTDSREESETRTLTDGGRENESVRPTGSPESVPQEWRCTDDEFTRYPTNYETVEWGDTDEISLRVSDTYFDYGDTARITLVNVSDEYVSTGDESDWGLEVHTDDGWEEVRGKTDGDTFDDTDLGADLPPDEGFEWEIELTEEGIVEPTPELTVCPDLESGRYRFVYWGIEPAVAVAFDLVHEGSTEA
ncbi:hypothetical protein NGM10_01615 [Halorussus salilacus]|uniref:hypothetical protein n=1 Tax=Halorussus salilacus TaxID=2953750 RepID=UPI00209EDD86|nr:hypothetical protein [Halorussus salilacus]USZ68450.1 hypothetical protein NGM10_01615 [Halorussus salilacus]